MEMRNFSCEVQYCFWMSENLIIIMIWCNELLLWLEGDLSAWDKFTTVRINGVMTEVCTSPGSNEAHAQIGLHTGLPPSPASGLSRTRSTLSILPWTPMKEGWLQNEFVPDCPHSVRGERNLDSYKGALSKNGICIPVLAWKCEGSNSMDGL